MKVRKLLRIFARSRSLRFTVNAARRVPAKILATLRWRGRNVFYRPGTSDPFVIYQILLRRGNKAEYCLPRTLEPKVILDIGSNIGASILFFHWQFPSARVYGFEPHPETFRILQANVGSIPAVEVFDYALGAANTTISTVFNGVDFSGLVARSGYVHPSGAATKVECEVKHAGEVMKSLGLARVDLIKIDCEGAECDVLPALPEEMLRDCKWIVGEMHNASSFGLLALLSPHFDLDLKKRMFVPFFRFHACNRTCVGQLKGAFDCKSLQR